MAEKVRNLYDFIVNKVKRKLSGWKKMMLSRAARSILNIVSNISHPTYAMQTIKLLLSILEGLEKLDRKFF